MSSSLSRKTSKCMIYDFIDRSLGVIEEVLNTNVLLLKPKFQENERGEPYKTIVGFSE